MRKPIPSIVLAVTILASCATTPDLSDESGILEFLSAIDASDPRGSVALSGLPFIYDREVLTRESDLLVLFEGLERAGFAFESAEVESVGPVDEPSDVGATFELRALGRRLVEEPVAIVIVEGSDGEYELLVEDRPFGKYVLRGMRGPM
jgi:hypothetical protein